MVDVKRIVAVAPEKLLESTQGTFLRLRHPHFEDGAIFFMKEDGSLWETQRFHEKFRSWFIGNSLKSDGSLYFITPYDPLFIALRYLSKKKEKFSTLDTVLDDPEFPAVKKVADMKLVTDRVHLIADVKTTAGFTVARFSSDRAMRWLEGRHSRVTQALIDHEVCCPGEGTAQATCFRSEEASDPEALRAFAHGLLAECLTPEMGAELAERLAIETTPAADENGKEEAQKAEEPPPAKKRRSVVQTSDYQEVFNKLVDQKKEAAEAKVKPKMKKQPGMQSITNFFGKK